MFWRLEAEIKVPAWSGEASLPNCRLLTFPHTSEGSESSVGSLSFRALILFMTTPPHDLSTFQRPHHLILIVGTRISMFGFLGDTNFQTIAVTNN